MTEKKLMRLVTSAPHTKEESASNSNGNLACSRSLQERIKVKKAFKAAKRGDLVALKKLIKNSVQANWLDDKGLLCLLDQAVFSESLPAVEWLLDMGADPCTLFRHDGLHPVGTPYTPGMYFSPFASAISLETPDIALLLLQRGASLDLPTLCLSDGGGMTCRQHAENTGRWPALEAWLISQAAKPAGSGSKRSPRL